MFGQTPLNINKMFAILYRGCGVMGARDLWEVEAPFKSGIPDQYLHLRAVVAEFHII